MRTAPIGTGVNSPEAGKQHNTVASCSYIIADNYARANFPFYASRTRFGVIRVTAANNIHIGVYPGGAGAPPGRRKKIFSRHFC